MLREAKELACSPEPIGRRDLWEVYGHSNSTTNLIARKDSTPYFTSTLILLMGKPRPSEGKVTHTG